MFHFSCGFAIFINFSSFKPDTENNVNFDVVSNKCANFDAVQQLTDALFSACSLRDDNVITSKPTGKLTETRKLYSSLLNISAKYHQIDPCNFELKVGSFFETQCTVYELFDNTLL